MAVDDNRVFGAGGEAPVAGTSQPDPQLAFLNELVAEHATVAGDVVEIDDHTWGNHGTEAGGGGVWMGALESGVTARMVRRELPVPPPVDS